MWWNGTGIGWGWMVFGMLWMVLFWGAVFALVVWVVRRITEPRRGTPSALHEPPVDILKARYARGEITKDQFDSMRRDMEG